MEEDKSLGLPKPIGRGKGNYPRDPAKHWKQLEALRSHSTMKSVLAQLRRQVEIDSQNLAYERQAFERVKEEFAEIVRAAISEVNTSPPVLARPSSPLLSLK